MADMKKSKKILLYLLIFFILNSASCRNLPEPQPVAENDPAEGPVVCLGDSLTSGYNIYGDKTEDRTKAYPAIIQKYTSMTVINAGICGDTTKDALFRLNRDVLSKNPAIVIVFLGANDFFYDFEFWFTKYNFYNILSNVTDGKRKVFLVKFLPDSVISWELEQNHKDKEPDLIIKQYNDLYSDLSKTFDVQIIDDIWDDFMQDDTTDGVHPDVHGHEIIGMCIYNAIRPFLSPLD